MIARMFVIMAMCLGIGFAFGTIFASASPIAVWCGR